MCNSCGIESLGRWPNKKRVRIWGVVAGRHPLFVRIDSWGYGNVFAFRHTFPACLEPYSVWCHLAVSPGTAFRFVPLPERGIASPNATAFLKAPPPSPSCVTKADSVPDCPWELVPNRMTFQLARVCVTKPDGVPPRMRATRRNGPKPPRDVRMGAKQEMPPSLGRHNILCGNEKATRRWPLLKWCPRPRGRRTLCQDFGRRRNRCYRRRFHHIARQTSTHVGCPSSNR